MCAKYVSVRYSIICGKIKFGIYQTAEYFSQNCIILHTFSLFWIKKTKKGLKFIDNSLTNLYNIIKDKNIMCTLHIQKNAGGGNNMLAQIQCYIIPIFICISFLAFIFAGNSTPIRRVSNYFILGTFLVLTIMILEIIEEVCFENCQYENWQRWFCSIAAYILRPTALYVMVLTLLRDRKDIKRKIILALPLFVNMVFLLISPACGIVFKFTETNIYVSGPLRALPFIVGLIYLVIFFVINAVQSAGNKKMTLTISVAVVFMSATACYLESVADLRGTLPLVYIVGMILYYSYFFMDYYIRDVLTGAYQRNKFDIDVKTDGYRYFIIIDINGLKIINDEMGHRHGDRALSYFGEMTRSVLPERAKFYRIGGDEFAILYPKAREDDVKKLMEKVKSEVDGDEVPFSFSYGYTEFNKSDEFNAAYKSADQMMYKNKEAFWKEYNRDGDVVVRRYHKIKK